MAENIIKESISHNRELFIKLSISSFINLINITFILTPFVYFRLKPTLKQSIELGAFAVQG